MMKRTLIMVALPLSLIVLTSTACGPSLRAASPTATPSPTPTRTPVPTATLTPSPTPSPIPLALNNGSVLRLRPEIIARYPHDPVSFTQGLVMEDGMLYESAGEYGQSSLRRVDLMTGSVLQYVAVPENFFAEGLALVDDRLIQLTWREQTAFIYDAATFEQNGIFDYEGEGWGLCYDGETLYRSDGTNQIVLHDADTFAPIDMILVTVEGEPITMLNELECVGGDLYANVWKTNQILRIDKRTGKVTAIVDAAGLLTPDETGAAGDQGVLNGIAYNPESDTFLITGKLWPWLFEVRFVLVTY